MVDADTTDVGSVAESRETPVGRGRRSWVWTALIAVTAVALVLLGGAAAVALRIGQDPVPTADSVDAGFARDMARHHVQGVEMANLALERSSDPEIRQIAFDISSTQTNQAGRMQGWLALWGLAGSGGETMAWMESGSASHDMANMTDMTDMAAPAGDALMPGMATEAELAELRSLSGPPFDARFLQLMIRHHQGGREMAQYAAQNASKPAVRTLAGAIAQTQTAEVATMEAMLEARGGTPLPAP